VIADLLVSAVGDVPNTDWLASSGLLTGGVLQVDTHGRVRPDVVAAGDVAAFPTPQGVRRIPLWTSAIERSKVAALGALLGDEAPELTFQPYFWTEQFGLALKSVGPMPVAGAPEVVDGDPRDGAALLHWAGVMVRSPPRHSTTGYRSRSCVAWRPLSRWADAASRATPALEPQGRSGAWPR